MGKHHVIGTALKFFGQPEIRLGHLEENFNIPTFSVNANDLFIRQMDIRGQKGQPISAAVTVPDKDNLGRNLFPLFIAASCDDDGSDNFGFTAFFANGFVQGIQVPFLPVIPVVHPGHSFQHTNHMDLLIKHFHDCGRETEPTIEQKGKKPEYRKPMLVRAAQSGHPKTFACFPGFVCNLWSACQAPRTFRPGGFWDHGN